MEAIDYSVLDKVPNHIKDEQMDQEIWKMSDLPKYLGWNGVVMLTPSDH